MTMYELEQEVRRAVMDLGFDLLEDEYYSDKLHEIADNAVPVYNSDRVTLLADNANLGFIEDASLIEGLTNIYEILGMSILESLLITANEQYQTIKSEYDDKENELDESKDVYISDIDDCESIKEVNDILEDAKLVFTKDFPKNDDRMEEVNEAVQEKINEILSEKIEDDELNDKDIE